MGEGEGDEDAEEEVVGFGGVGEDGETPQTWGAVGMGVNAIGMGTSTFLGDGFGGGVVGRDIATIDIKRM